MRKLPIYLTLLVALAVVVELLWHTPLRKGGEAPPVQTSVLVEDAATGARLASARLTRLEPSGDPLGTPFEADSAGRVRLFLSSPRLVEVTAAGHQPRVLALGPQREGTAPVVVPLVEESPEDVSLRIGGQVMMGRGLYQPQRDGTRVIRSATSLVDHQRVLTQVAPLFSDADLGVVTLVGPLLDHPYVGGPRPVGYHRYRASVLAASPLVADSLAEIGVRVVNLATSHAYDALAGGLDSTLRALDDAGLAHVGAGATVADAWAPAYAEVRDQTIAFVACTTRTGGRYDLGFVANSRQGGAAHCRPDRLASTITEAAGRADAVVVMLDAGPTREITTPQARRTDEQATALARVAADAGAALVVASRSHVPREVASVGTTPWLKGLGDLVFDDSRWTSMRAGIARVVLHGGAVTSGTIDPVARIGWRPVPSVGPLADAQSRQFAGSGGPAQPLSGTAAWPGSGESETATVSGDPGALVSVPTGSWPTGAESGVSAGHDLLWGTGSMEDLETDPADSGTTLWALGKYVTTSFEASCTGVQGLRLRRGPLSAKDVVISPQLRTPVTPGQHLTLTALVGLASEGASLEVRWYRTFDPAKRSSGLDSVEIVPHRLRSPCVPVKLDLVVPEGMVAAEPYVRLSPRHDVNLAAELRVDDIRLIAWSDGGQDPRLQDTVRLPASGQATVTSLAP